MGDVIGGRLFPQPEQQELRRTFSDRWAENDPRAYREALNAIIGWSITEQLHRIECPALLIAAKYDYTPIEEKATLASRIKQAELVIIKNSRHGTPADQPEKFNEAVMAFLSKQD